MFDQTISYTIRDMNIYNSEMETHEREYKKFQWLREWILENTKYDDQKPVKLSKHDLIKLLKYCENISNSCEMRDYIHEFMDDVHHILGIEKDEQYKVIRVTYQDDW